MKNSNIVSNTEKTGVNFWQLVSSTLAAFFGVQSDRNRERDFTHGKFSHFIWMGLLVGLIFLATLIGIVQLVLRFNGY